MPYRFTGAVVGRLRLEEDLRSTYKLLVGIVSYLVWLIVLAALAGGLWGGAAAVASLLLVPAAGVAGLLVRERWHDAWGDARRFFLLRSRRELVAGLRRRQRDLAVRIQTLYEREQGVASVPVPGLAGPVRGDA